MIRLYLLGSPRVVDGADRTVDAVIAQSKRFGLLAYLAADTTRGPKRRDELVALFWPDLDEPHARRALTYALHFLRRALGDGVIIKHRTDDLEVDDTCLWTDASAFEQALEDKRYEEALKLYRGDFLAGFFAADSPELEQWADARRLRLRERARSAAWSLIEATGRSGDLPGRTRWARRALELASDDERALRELVASLHAAGDAAGAFAEYDHFARHFEEMHGTAVAPQTRLLVDTLRTSPAAATTTVVMPSAVGQYEPPASARATPLPLLPAATAAAPVVAQPVRTRQRLTRGIALAMVATLALAITGLVFSARRSPDAPRTADATTLVAVLPFTYHGVPELSYTGDGLTTLLSAGMDRVGGIRTVSARLLLGATHSPGDRVMPQDAAKTAKRLGAASFVLGDITGVGRRLRVSATMYDDQARALGRAVEAEGGADSLFELVDVLTSRLAAGHVSTGAGVVSSAATQGTRSMPALRAFLEGERQFRSGHYQAAILAYKEGVAADSAFALAYLRMSQAANWTGDTRLERVADERVQALRDGLPLRERRRAEAWHQTLSQNVRQADSLYRALVAEDPTDVEGWYYLADAVFHQGTNIGTSAAESRPAWERVVALNPEDASAYIHLARLAAARGDRAAFDSLARGLALAHPSDELSFEIGALRVFAFGDSAARSGIAHAPELRAMSVPVGRELAAHLTGSSSDLAGVDAVWRTVGVQTLEPQGQLMLYRAAVAAARGNLARADVLVDSALLSTPAISLRYRAFLATLPFLDARPAAMARARAAITRGDTIARTVGAAAWREFFLGVMAIRSGDDTSAARLSSSLDQRAARGKNMAVQLAPILRAEVAMHAGRTADALAALGPLPNIVMWIGDPSSGLASAQDRWMRAELTARLGRPRDALRLYASFPDVTGSDVTYAPPAHLRQAEILEQLGERAEAARHYRRALGYWRGARADVASLVARATAGLARMGER